MDPRAHLKRPVPPTPYGKGSGSRMSDYCSEHTRESYRSFLDEDIAGEEVLSVENFVKLVLGCDNWAELVSSPEVQDISNSDWFNSLVNKYGESDKEEDLYEPFNLLVNHILEGSGTGTQGSSGMTVCRNDPITIRGSADSRSPDAIGAESDAIYETDRVSPDNCKDSGPEMLPFHWLEVLWYIEFKLTAWAKAQMKREMEDFKCTASAVADILHSPPRDTGKPSNSKVKSGSARKSTGKNTKQRNPSKKRYRNRPWNGDRSKEVPTAKRIRTGPTEAAVKRQCASYALEMLSNGGLRLHALGLYLSGYNLQIQFFDRSIFISSEAFSFRKDPCTFIALLLVLRSLDDDDLGFMPGFDRDFMKAGPDNSPEKAGLRSTDFLTTKTLKLNNGWELHFKEVLARHHGLIGRGTIVSRALIVTSDSEDACQNRVVAVKISSPAVSRKREYDILQLAYSEARQRHEKMLNHLPMVEHWEDLNLAEKSPRNRLAGFYTNEKYEVRALRVIAFRELWPLHEVTEASELSKVFRDIFHCYRWLYEEVAIFHRDITLDNLMFYRKEGTIHGILNDFDLATIVGDSSPSSKQRTGNRAFMAQELLEENPLPHLYRHDLESLFYVILILTTHYEDGKEVKEPPFKTWFSETSHALRGTKVLLLGGPLSNLPTVPYKDFVNWLLPMKAMFKTAVTMQESKLDVETYGGEITFDRMAKIFDIKVGEAAVPDPSPATSSESGSA